MRSWGSASSTIPTHRADEAAVYRRALSAMEPQVESASEHEQLLAAIAAIRAGDRDAFAAIVRLYQRRLYSLALMVVRDSAGAEDVVQETFVRAYHHLHRYEPARAFYPWIATIAARLALNWRRNRARLVFQEPEASQLDTQSALDALGESIEEERARELWSAVNTLSPGERTAVLLFYRQDMSIADVAQVLGVTAGSVKTLLFRAREKLRKTIGDRVLLDPHTERSL
jgi:RNA polymerase sigma-70 factor (ECF subfamily)